MYIPDQFSIKDHSIAEDFIRQNGFATLVSSGEHYPYATHVPLELEPDSDGKKVLAGHMAKANPHWRSFGAFHKVTAIFLSPIHHYISSSWYDHANAPTWNYLSVHVSGIVRLVDAQRTWDSVKRLTDRYEQASRCPVSLDALPRQVQAEMNGLVAFEIEIDKIEAAFKLSQNRDDINHERILNELVRLGDARSLMMAELMRTQRRTQ